MANEKIKGKCVGSIDAKRFYMPGVTLEATCPECNKACTVDFESDHLSYPDAGKPFSHGLYCSECEHEWSVNLELKITLKVVAE